MNRKLFVRTISIVVSLIAIVAMFLARVLLKQKILLPIVISIAFIVVLLIIYFSLDVMQKENNKEIEGQIDIATKQALKFGRMGILVYSDDYQITWMSEFFAKNHIEHIGEKLLNWIPELQDMLQGEEDTTTVVINDEKYRINKIANSYVLIFEDITTEYDLNNELNDNAYVLGLVTCDNYDESQESEDDISFVNSNVKAPVTEYFKKFGCVYKTLKNNRLLLLLNESIYKKIFDDRFSIVRYIRKVASDANLDVTLSMAFTYGSTSLTELDEEAEKLMELAQTRGGDQVVVRKIGEDVSFYGGNSEAREKLNKTKVKVNINTIKDLVSKSSKVIIAGHKNADADCVGASICMSNIVSALGKQAHIIYRTSNVIGSEYTSSPRIFSYTRRTLYLPLSNSSS